VRIRWLPSAALILVVVLIMNLGCSQRSTMCPGMAVVPLRARRQVHQLHFPQPESMWET